MTKLTLPKPNGKYSVGFFDGFFEYEGEGEKREVGYRMFYPAIANTGKDAYYFVDKEMHNAFIEANPNGPFNEVTKEFVDLKINAKGKARTADGVFDVVIYSHSFGSLPWSNLVQIESLVSHGYVVVAISHTGDTFCTMLGDRRIARDMETAGSVMQELIGYMIDGDDGGKKDPADYTPEDVSTYIEKCGLAKKVISRWIDNISSLIDELQKLNKDKERLIFNRLNVGKVGVFGNSLGGAAALSAALKDSRVACAINMDGWQMDASLLKDKLDVPGLFLTKNRIHYQGNYGTQNGLIDCIQITGSSNLMMSDYNILFEDGIKRLEENQEGIDGKLMSSILSDLIRGFFDKHIKNDDCLEKETNEKYKEHLVLGKEDLFV